MEDPNQFQDANARRISRRHFWVDPLPTGSHLRNIEDKRVQLAKVLDLHEFNWQVWAVAATGFFTDSYNLFATNVILPIIAYIYWYDETSYHNEIAINAVSLAGSVVGQLLFGILADRFGRQRLYGVELTVVIFATLGVVQAGWGIDWVGDSRHSMSILGWLLTWRFVMGVGIGAEYPLSSIITTEWASHKSRAKMLAAVFLMQPLGQAAAYIVCLVVLLGLDASYNIKKETDPRIVAPVVDKLWRWVTGLGAIPAIVAIIFRLTIPETGRWTLDVQHDYSRAMLETRAHYGASSESVDDDLNLGEELQGLYAQSQPSPASSTPIYRQFSLADLKQFFLTEGNWRYLAATSGCWFLLDFAYYGLQINTPRLVARLWQPSRPANTTAFAPSWQSAALTLTTILNITETETDPRGILPTVVSSRGLLIYDTSLYHIILTNAWHALVVISLGSLIGSLLMIQFINYLPRKKLLTWSFIVLAGLVTITGISFLFTFDTNAFGVTMMLYIACQILFNFGPNTLTFIIPAEIFPTRYRGTCHGISAAAGKIASVIVQVTLPHMKFGGRAVSDLNSNTFGYVLIIFGAILVLGAPLAWAWLPNVQQSRGSKGLALPGMKLEILGKGRKEAEANGQTIGMRRRIAAVFGARRV